MSGWLHLGRLCQDSRSAGHPQKVIRPRNPNLLCSTCCSPEARSARIISRRISEENIQKDIDMDSYLGFQDSSPISALCLWHSEEDLTKGSTRWKWPQVQITWFDVLKLMLDICFNSDLLSMSFSYQQTAITLLYSLFYFFKFHAPHNLMRTFKFSYYLSKLKMPAHPGFDKFVAWCQSLPCTAHRFPFQLNFLLNW